MKSYIESYKELARLGLPIVAGQAGIIFVGFADNMMVGHYSTDALASASFVNNLFNIAILACIGFTYGITPLVGALFGRGETEAIGRLMRNALLLNLVFVIMITGVMGYIYTVLPHLGQPEHLLPVIRPYYLLYLAGVVPIALFNVFAQWSYGIRRTAMPVCIVLSTNVLNVIGNYFLIYGHFGAPELGLTGAGISTLVARWLGLVIIMLIFFRARANREYKTGFIHAGADGQTLRRVFMISLPIALQLSFECGSFSIAAVMAGWIGAIELAAFQVMVVVGQLGFCFYYSVGTATSVMVANDAGRGDIRAMRRDGFAGYHFTLVMCVLACLSFCFFGHRLIGLFTSDPSVMATCMSLIVPLLLYQLSDATQTNFANSLRGTSKVMPMLWISFFSYVVVGVPATYLMGFTFGMGIYGIFLSFSVSLFLAAVLFLFFFLRNTRTSSILINE
ncbi:MAG: MATE family efflux transporter [Muribaculaceae bacterium]|nr:MATE family efflux transporter [Muribaculaceae bacterium]MDE6316214.1 MATE family efflux transporter [Muribaculaceae bacterium]